MADAPLYKRKRTYTRELHDVELHGNNKIHVVWIRKAYDVDKMLCKLRRKLVVMPFKRIGVDVEYTHYEDPHKAAVLQLCVENELLVYHISATKYRPRQLDEFLMNEEYTFVGFTIEGYKKNLKLSNLENN
ncbi:hypothetical protein ZWY2020_052135 [Hordeum vulgare]|nr:hypothetical protein ZWY2020_052135 [Hordeum vulgare]